MVIVKGLIVRDGRYLLGKVPDTVRVVEFRGKWDLPGGHLEEGDSPRETLVRELKEELGVDSRRGDLVYEGVIVLPGVREEFLVFQVEEITGEMVLSEHERVERARSMLGLCPDVFRGLGRVNLGYDSRCK